MNSINIVTTVMVTIIDKAFKIFTNNVFIF